MPGEVDTYFVVTAPGLGPLAADELRRLGISLPADNAADGRFTNEEGGGGVLFQGGLEDLYKANLHLRTASRVLVRLGDFKAAAFSELRMKAGRLAWERFLTPGQPVLLHVTCHKSKLYHSGAVAERVLGAVGDRLGKPSTPVTGQEAMGSTEAIPPQLVVVRLLHDHCTISIDSSGHLLHRRGYRLETAKAPLRETLAAAMLLASGWDTRSPLIDPFCGSGTIAIEAALLARGIPPGQGRAFAFMRWPRYNPRRWEGLVSGIPTPPNAEIPRIQASDRDAGAIKIARVNAARAGVAEMIAFENKAMSAIEPPPIPGWLVTNPPYGIRVSAGNDLRNLYAQLGNVLRARCSGWQVAILCSDLRLLGQTGLRLDTSLSFVNGGVSVKLGRGKVNDSIKFPEC
jgi:putative N6-adenine-specific DNA methylase